MQYSRDRKASGSMNLFFILPEVRHPEPVTTRQFRIATSRGRHCQKYLLHFMSSHVTCCRSGIPTSILYMQNLRTETELEKSPCFHGFPSSDWAKSFHRPTTIQAWDLLSAYPCNNSHSTIILLYRGPRCTFECSTRLKVLCTFWIRV